MWVAVALCAGCASSSGVADGGAGVADGGGAADATVAPDASSSDASVPPDAAVAALCGDRVVSGAEACDDGNTSDGDDCPADCTDGAAFMAYDGVLKALMSKWDLPGLAVAVSRDDRLVLVRAYGMADRVAGEPLRRDALFRIASISKPFTAAAIVRLVEQGRLTLDQPAFAILDHLRAPQGAAVDPRLATITVRHLLTHSGGWDRAKSGDPMFKSREIARDMGVPSPPGPEVIIRWMMGKPLDFTPGAEYQYSNFGYAVLGRIVEKVTGKSYEQAMQELVMAPAGVTRMKLGRTHLADRAPDEVRYHAPAGEPMAPSVFDGEAGQVPFEYGAFALEPLDSHGGWIAGTIDLVRFATAMDGHPARPDLVTPASRTLIAARPTIPSWQGQPAWYGLGWLVRPVLGGDANWWHGGSLPGTTTLLVRTAGGYSWAALTNTRPNDFATFDGELDAAMWQAFATVRESDWPTGDLFGSYR